MKALGFVLWLLFLGTGAVYAQATVDPVREGFQGTVDPAREALYVSLVEKNGCKMTLEERWDILSPHDFTPEESYYIVTKLVSDDVFSIVDQVLILKNSEKCK